MQQDVSAYISFIKRIRVLRGAKQPISLGDRHKARKTRQSTRLWCSNTTGGYGVPPRAWPIPGCH